MPYLHDFGGETTYHLSDEDKGKLLFGSTPDGKIAPFDFNKFSLNGDSVAMEAQILTDTYVLGELAILGQLTAF
jgi:hypothetical protein